MLASEYVCHAPRYAEKSSLIASEQAPRGVKLPPEGGGGLAGWLESTHGALALSHERPLSRIDAVQQLSPPGRDPHPVPPHVPQELGQHTVPAPLAMPLEQRATA